MENGVEMRCPACQASQTTAGELNCMTCGMTFAYVSLFANYEAFIKQRERITAKREQVRPRLGADFRRNNRLVIGYHNIVQVMMTKERLSNRLTNHETNGFDFGESMCHRLTCGNDGRPYASGGRNEWGETTLPGDGHYVRCYAVSNVSYWISGKGVVSICGKAPQDNYALRDLMGVRDLAIMDGGQAAALLNNGTVLIAGQAGTINNIIAIAAGRNFVLCLNNDGRIKVTPNFQALARGWTPAAENAVNQTEAWTNVAEIAAYGTTIVALKADGTLSIADMQGNERFNDASGWRDIVAISAGFGLLLGIDKNGIGHYAGTHINPNVMRQINDVGITITQ